MLSLEYLDKLSRSKVLQDLEWDKCQSDAYYFLINWAYTLDVHDREQSIKTFPDKEYLKILTETWLKEPLLLVPKSRQMMMSWIFTSLYGWDAFFHKGRLTFFQSKREDDADDLVKRTKFVWDKMPKFLKRYKDHNGQFKELKCNPQHHGQHVSCRMSFPEINSEIRGIPEGGDIIRMHTASGILSDEMAFQPEAKNAYTAAKPTISSNGRFTGVSTADDRTFFEALVMDTLEMN